MIDKKTGIWDMSIAKKRHKCDLTLTGAIGTFYNPKSVADIGCGDGKYCSILKTYGIPIVHGYEGTQDIKSLGIYDDIFIIDLTKKRVVDIQYDLALCLETGEHIPPEYEQIFIDNVCEYISEDLIMSWAIPGQYSASGHVNNKDNAYIIQEFEKRGLKFIPDMTNLLRMYASLKWFKNTLMVFKRR